MVPNRPIGQNDAKNIPLPYYLFEMRKPKRYWAERRNENRTRWQNRPQHGNKKYPFTRTCASAIFRWLILSYVSRRHSIDCRQPINWQLPYHWLRQGIFKFTSIKYCIDLYGIQEFFFKFIYIFYFLFSVFFSPALEEEPRRNKKLINISRGY